VHRAKERVGCNGLRAKLSGRCGVWFDRLYSAPRATRHPGMGAEARGAIGTRPGSPPPQRSLPAPADRQDPTWVSRRRTPMDGARRVFSPVASGHGPRRPRRGDLPPMSAGFAGQDRDARSDTGETSVRDLPVEGATACAICPTRRGQRHLPRPRSARHCAPPTADRHRRAAPREVLALTCGFPGSPLSDPPRSGNPRDRCEPQWRKPGTGSSDPKERPGHEERGVRCRCARTVRDVCCRPIPATMPCWRSRGSPPPRRVQRPRVSEGFRWPAAKGRFD